MSKASNRNRLAQWAPTVGRLVLGTIFIAHGAQKLFGWFGGKGIDSTIQMVGSMGFSPAPLWGWLLALTEFAGGLAVLLGLGSRAGAAFISVAMVVAMFKVHLPNGFFASNGGFEFNLALIGLSISQVLSGPGKLSLESAIHSFIESEQMAPARPREELRHAA